MADPSGKDPEPGGGIRNTRTTHAFRAINFELFAKPVSPVSIAIGLMIYMYAYLCKGVHLSRDIYENFNTCMYMYLSLAFIAEQDCDDHWSSWYYPEPGLYRILEHFP